MNSTHISLRTRGWLLGLALLMSPAAPNLALAQSNAPSVSAAGLSKGQKTRLRREYGIEVEFVRHTSAGYMLEFRYRVHDARLAAPLFEREDKPLLTHVETGAQLSVPAPGKTGPLRNSNPPIQGKAYWVFFANPGVYVKKGDVVAIEIGGFQVAGLVVQ